MIFCVINIKSDYALIIAVFTSYKCLFILDKYGLYEGCGCIIPAYRRFGKFCLGVLAHSQILHHY